MLQNPPGDYLLHVFGWNWIVDLVLNESVARRTGEPPWKALDTHGISRYLCKIEFLFEKGEISTAKVLIMFIKETHC